MLCILVPKSWQSCKVNHKEILDNGHNISQWHWTTKNKYTRYTGRSVSRQRIAFFRKILSKYSCLYTYMITVLVTGVLQRQMQRLKVCMNAGNENIVNSNLFLLLNYSGLCLVLFVTYNATAHRMSVRPSVLSFWWVLKEHKVRQTTHSTRLPLFLFLFLYFNILIHVPCIFIIFVIKINALLSHKSIYHNSLFV